MHKEKFIELARKYKAVGVKEVNGKNLMAVFAPPFSNADDFATKLEAEGIGIVDFAIDEDGRVAFVHLLEATC